LAPDPARPDGGGGAAPVPPEATGSESGPDAPLLQVGYLVKPHGLRGDIIVSLTTNRDERVAPGSELTTSDGRRLRVVRSSPHQGRFIVTFHGVNGIDEANALRATELFAPPLEDPDALWVHELIGARVEDTAGTELGTVEGVEANPASDLLVLKGGVLIPLRFVVDSQPGVLVTVDVPDGLFDLA
jgi:16S rRNA processing protein RimM